MFNTRPTNGLTPFLRRAKRDEDFVAKDEPSMTDPGSWCHRYPHIKTQGRCEFFCFPVPEPEEGEEAVPEPEPEQSPELLATLDSDAESVFVDWGAAVVSAPEGDDESAVQVTTPKPAWAHCTSSNVPGVKYIVVGIKSLVWPGAFVAYASGKFSNCYVGYGFQNRKFVPTPPPIVEPEFDLGGQVVDAESGETSELKMVMSAELPPIPEPEPEPEAEEEEAVAE